MTDADLAGFSVLVVGTGLIGTSTALAAGAAGAEVFLHDADPRQAALAGDLGAGVGWAGERVDHALVAVPPGAVAAALRWLQQRTAAATYSDTSSVQSRPYADALALEVDVAAWCGGHPVAGREKSGPAAARPELFAGRPWVLCPNPATSQAARQMAARVARACGATVVWSDPAAHDEALAAVSHLPQLVASLLAGTLVDLPADAVALAGQGLRDTTRLAGSDPALWADIASLNAAALHHRLAVLRTDLDQLLAAFAEPVDPQACRDAVEAVLRRGGAGRARLPGKHGSVSAAYTGVPVLVEDAPGRLAVLFGDVAAIGVNVEDVVIEHAPGRPHGVVELAVRPEAASRLATALVGRGWSVHPR